MQKRKLGRSGLEVSAIGLGCRGLSFGLGPAMERGEAIKLILAAAEIELTPDDLRDIERAVSEVAVQGARYPAQMQQLVER